MTDPFEVRMVFTRHLSSLNASTTSAQKAAQYALRHKDLAEDLHSCILEQLKSKTSMNARANIMYFIEHFLDLASRADATGHKPYITMMQRDIIQVVDAVVPEDGSGAANVKMMRKVLGSLQTKEFLSEEVVRQINEVLRERGDGQKKVDKRVAEQRIEEDRERHKRLRENKWVVPTEGYAELEKLWEETSDLGEDDYRAMEDEKKEWDEAQQQGLCPHQGGTSGRAG